MSSVEQIRGRRAGVGLRALDPARACPGFTMFAPLTADARVYLVDLRGTVVHSWTMPYPPGLYGYLTDRGTLFYNAKVIENDGRFISGTPWKGGAVLEAVVEMADRNIALSFRNTSTVIIVDRRSGKTVWRLGPPVLAQQHAPTPLVNGNLLIFDNGTHRIDHWLPHSRVIEVSLATKEIIWSYRERRIIDFFSPLISNAQRLPNGNTLICEGSYGGSSK